jgi:hypothetical protein
MYEQAPYNVIERIGEMDRPKFAVTKVREGFEFGHGKISGVAANEEVLELVEQTIYDPRKNRDLLVPIDTDDSGEPIKDDGCGDGRGVLTIFSYDETFHKSLNRPKVFGGSSVMAVACVIGLGEAGNLALNPLFERVIKTLDEKNINFGAHTDEHAYGKNCGCGAIDRADEVLFAIPKYEFPIRGVVTMLSTSLELPALNEVYQNFRSYVDTLAQQPEYSGKQVMDTILENNRTRVVKQLGDEHKECRIVLNTVRGYTVNQKLIRDVTGNEAQIFAVDVWRMQDIASSLYPDQPELQAKAFLSELIYTLATAAVLTKGDLPIDLITEAA